MIATEAVRLRGRDRELTELDALVVRARCGQSAALVVIGEAGIGKTALLDDAAARAAARINVERIVASEAEMQLPYAGLQQLCGHMMRAAGHLPVPQREALETALGLREAPTANPFLVGLAVLGLLTEIAGDHALLCVVDDAQWLDEVSARTIAFVARRLDAEGIAIALAMRTADRTYAGLPQLIVQGLGDDDARALLHVAMPGVIDEQVGDRIVAESRGNPLALRELPRAVNPPGGFPVAKTMPLESRIEQSLVAQLDALPESTRMLLMLAAADPTGDPALLWRASSLLGLGQENLDAAEHADALVVGTRVSFRHPLVRSAVYRAASPEDRRAVHAALAESTHVERDPDRRAWHRASATLRPDEEAAADLVQSAARAKARGGAAAAAAFLERAAELSPAPISRARRLIAAAEARHDAGSPEAVLRLLDSARGNPLTALQHALIARLRARAGYALRRDASAAQQLLAAAQDLETLDPALARDTYMEALCAAAYGGRLGDADEVALVARAILRATAADESERPRDLILRGQALLAAEGFDAAIPTLRDAVRAFLDQPPDELELRWLWFGARAARDLWDADALRTLAERQVDLARAQGVLTVLPVSLSVLMLSRTIDGRLDAAVAACEEIDAIANVTGQPFPQSAWTLLAALRGQVDDVERRARQLRADGHARGEGYALSAASYAESLAYNGAGRHAEALAVARREVPYVNELTHGMCTMFELVEAASRTGEDALAAEAFEALANVLRPLGDNNWARAMMAIPEAQLRDGDEAEVLFREGIERFERERIPMMVGRSRLLYGEMLRRRHRRIEAGEQLRAAHDVLSRRGIDGFARRAERELAATGETVRVRKPEAVDQLTDQELNVARLAREGLTNRDIGERLFISARTAEYHLRKVFVKLGIGSRDELKTALGDLA